MHRLGAGSGKSDHHRRHQVDAIREAHDSIRPGGRSPSSPNHPRTAPSSRSLGNSPHHPRSRSRPPPALARRVPVTRIPAHRCRPPAACSVHGSRTPRRGNGRSDLLSLEVRGRRSLLANVDASLRQTFATSLGAADLHERRPQLERTLDDAEVIGDESQQVALKEVGLEIARYLVQIGRENPQRAGTLRIRGRLRCGERRVTLPSWPKSMLSSSSGTVTP